MRYIDILNPRSSYPQGKRMAECLCICYASQFGVPAKIARLSQTFGAGVSYDDQRVFAQFARSAIEQKDIILHSKGGTIRNYCYVSDDIAAILLILLRGGNREIYNVANKDCTLSIREMADLVAGKITRGSIKVVEQLQDTATTGYLPEMRLVLDAGKLEPLGWQAKYGIEEMYNRMIRSMKNRRSGDLKL